MDIVRVCRPRQETLDQIRAVMDRAFDGDFDGDDWEHALGGEHVICRESGLPVGHAAVVPRRLYVGDEVLRCGYVEAFGVRPSRQRSGIGTAILDAVREAIETSYDVGALGTGAHGFYARRGWRRWEGPTYVVADGEWRRTPEEDDAVMVLAVDPRVTLDLTAKIAVDDRPGDAW